MRLYSNDKMAKFKHQIWQSKTKHGRNITLAYDLLTSKAYLDLTSVSKEIYTLLCMKFNGRNSDNISLTYSESKKNIRSYQKAISQLIRNGFIELVRQGKFNKECNIYKFSRNWIIYPNNTSELPDWKCNSK